MKRNLYVLTLEPLEQRYTAQWYSYWKQEFSNYFNVIYIDGPKMSDKIESGQFLDINKTNIWKAEQVKKVSTLFAEKKIKDDDIFIWMDFWHFGITAVKYMIQLQKMNCKMYGYCHAGSYDPWDFIAQAGLDKWASYNEVGWFRALDGSFVATHYHKQLICDRNEGVINPSKIHVVGFPMDWEAEIKSKLKHRRWNRPRKQLIVFPHRIAPEKQPKSFDDLAIDFPKAEFVKTMEVTKTKKEYYNLMSDALAMFSNNKQETFGIGTVEALMMDVVPIVPNRLSYRELYDSRFLYNNIKDAKYIIQNLLEFGIDKSLQLAMKDNKNKIIKNSLSSIRKMSKIMGGK